MMRSLVLFFIALTIQGLPSLDWVLVEKGNEALANRQLADALKLFREARNFRDVFPEAELGIGRVYEAEQNFPLALRQYELALENSWALELPDQEVFLKYHIARIHWIMEDFIQYERVLKGVVDLESDDMQWLVTNARRVLFNSGIDRMLMLFRLEQDEKFLSYRELGGYLVIHGRDSAVDYLLLAFLQSVTPMVNYLQQIDPLYEFTTLKNLLVNMGEEEDLAFIESVRLYQIIYYLALAIRSFDFASPASQELLTFLSTHRESGQWASLAHEQLQQSFIPTLMEYSPNFSLSLF